MRPAQSQEDGDVHPCIQVGGSFAEGFKVWCKENPEMVKEWLDSWRQKHSIVSIMIANRKED